MNIIINIAILIDILITFHPIILIGVELFFTIAPWHLLFTGVIRLESTTSFRIEVLASPSHFLITSYLSTSASIDLFITEEVLINLTEISNLFLTDLDHSCFVFGVLIELMLDKIKISEFIDVHSVVHFEVLFSSLIIVHILRAYLFQPSESFFWVL